MPTIEQVLQQIWTDDATKRKLEANPKAFLKDYGIVLPPNMNAQLHEDSLSVKNFVLPEKIEGEVPKSQDPAVNIILRAMKDPAFKAKLLSDPKATVRGAGIAVPDAIDIRVFQNSPDTLHLVLPTNPKDSELSDADLEAVAGGVSKSDQLSYASAGAGTGCGIAAGALAFTAVGSGIAGAASAAAAGSTIIASQALKGQGK